VGQLSLIYAVITNSDRHSRR